MKNTQKKAILFLTIVLFVSVRSFAQDGPPGDPGVPFDGLSLALVAGLGYGVKKLVKKKKEKQAEQELNK